MKSIVTLIFLIIVFIYVIPSLSPELAIRRSILLKLHPIEALTIDIRKTNIIDNEYGYLYDVEGFVDRLTMNEITDFYLKKNIIGWYVYSIGKGLRVK